MSQHNSGMDYLGESNSSVSFPVTFVWPYGGRNVYLCGSFNAWQQYQMMPIELEGLPTVFQVTCRLPAGHHEYKFLVDGEWRFDENKTYISGTYGIVNTISVTTTHDYLASFPSLQTTTTPDIDLQTELFQHLHIQQPSDSLTFPRIPDTDMQISRRRILDFLSTHTAYELMPSSGKVIALDVDLPVKQAFHILLEQGIPVAPLFDFRKGQFTGILSALDFILIMKELRNRGYNTTDVDLNGYTISAWKGAKQYLSSGTNSSGGSTFRQLVQTGPDINQLVVAMSILQNRVSVLPVLDYTSLDEGGAYPHLLHLTSLSDILEGICRHFRFSVSSLPVLQLPISAIHLGTWGPTFEQPNRRPLAMLKPNASLIDGLDLFVQAQVSAIPIVDDNGVLLNIYSRSDIMSLAKDNLFALINLDETTMYQAIEYRDKLLSLETRQQRYHVCFPTDPLYTVLGRLSKPGVRRLVIVDSGTKRVVGIVSVSDVVRFFLSDSNSSNSSMKL